MNTRALIG